MSKYTFSILLSLCIYMDVVAQKNFDSLDSLINLYEINDDFNGVMLIAIDGQIVFSRSIGYANFEKQIALNLHTPMHLASITKVFTNMAILILSERGLLNYHDKVSKYLSNFPYDEITIQHLMTSTSGLKRVYHQDSNGDGIITNKELMDFLSMKKPKLSFTPGNQHQSSVVGYCVLAEIIENVSNESFTDFIEKEILQPSRMSDTFMVTKYNLDQFRAVSYNKKNKEKEWHLGSYLGGVGIYSSALDLLKLDQVLYTNLVISSETIIKSYNKIQLNNGAPGNLTLGSWMYWEGQENLIFKNGDWVANNSILFRDIKNHATIIIMTNRQNRISKFDLMDIILPELAEKNDE